MTNLEQFLSKDKKGPSVAMEPISGSFSCQDDSCNEVMTEGYIDRDKSRIHWVCSQKHDSSVII
jgi:hypothetical protein